MSDVARWQRVEAAFHALADDAPGPAREARLAALCDGDAAMSAEVAGLLAADAGPLARVTDAGASREAPAAPGVSASRTPSSRRPS